MRNITSALADITDFIFVSDEPERADVIFIPGGSYPEIAERAAELYRGGFAPIVMPSGMYSVKRGSFPGAKSRSDVYTGEYATECEFLTDVLVKNGVPRWAMIGEDRATYTRENAFLSREKADSLGMKVERAIICCKSFHARRCLMYYALAFPETEFLICPADTQNVSRESWTSTERGIELVLGELSRSGGQTLPDVTARGEQSKQ